MGLTLLVILGGVVGGLLGGGDGGSRRGATSTAPTAGAGGTGPNSDPADAALARMTTNDKVAQVFLWGFTGQGAGASVLGRLPGLDLGGVVVARPNYGGPAALRDLTTRVRDAAARARHVRPWVMADQPGGAEFNALPGLPPATTPADLDDARKGAAEAKAAARALRGLGVNGVLGPVLDVAPDDNVAVGALAYSDDPGEVAAFARRTAAAYRGERVFSAPSHFPGLGSATQSPEQGPASVSLSGAQLSRQDLRPFRAAIDEGAPGVLVSNGLYVYDDFVTPASLSRKVMGDLLRKRLGFRGIAVTDDLTDPAVTALEPPPRAAVEALRAGADMLYVSGPAADQEAAYRAIVRAVSKGAVTRARLDEAVRRVLQVKRDYGLLAPAR